MHRTTVLTSSLELQSHELDWAGDRLILAEKWRIRNISYLAIQVKNKWPAGSTSLTAERLTG
jgi:hypothetical protein